MHLLYNIGIQLYFYFISFFSNFNHKAKLWIIGRKKNIPDLKNKSIWFHFASLGEFEQGRPVLEQIRPLYPDYKIIVTFFSPSGYEIRKNTPLADAVYYLPLDTAKNAANFIDTIKPVFAVFTKYEYWFHYFNEMHQRQIPVYIISGIFRPGQIFFKWYGSLHRQMLGFVSHFFVQDEKSKELLKGLGINNVEVSGDTRFDRVWENAQQPKNIPYIAEFKNGQKLLVAGSTWPPDEQLLAKLVTKHPNWKFIIAPHEIGEDKINSIINSLPANSTVRYSELTTHHSQITTPDSKLIPIAIGTQNPKITSSHSRLTTHNSLIIDNIGMLSSLYQYADIAFIGGGFGAGIHNTLEAASFGLPVIFGPNYAKFKEAHELVDLKAGFSIKDDAELMEVFDELNNDELFAKMAGERSYNYVKEHVGATEKILTFISTSKNSKTFVV